MAPVLRSATRSRATGRWTTTEPKSRTLKKKTTKAKPRARTQAKKKKEQKKKIAKVEPVEGDSERRIRSSVVSAVFSEGLMRNTTLEHLEGATKYETAKYRALAIYSMYINGWIEKRVVTEELVRHLKLKGEAAETWSDLDEATENELGRMCGLLDLPYLDPDNDETWEIYGRERWRGSPYLEDSEIVLESAEREQMLGWLQDYRQALQFMPAAAVGKVVDALRGYDHTRRYRLSELEKEFVCRPDKDVRGRKGAAGVGKGPMLPEREGPASPPKAPVSTQLDRVGSEGRGFEPHVGCNRTVAQSGPSTGLARLAQLVEHQTLTDDFFARRRGGTPRFCAAALCSVRMGGNVCVDCPPRGSAAWPRPHRSRSPMSTFTVTHKRTDRGGGTVLDWAERTRKACADSLRVLQSTRLVTFPPVADKYRSWKDGGG